MLKTEFLYPTPRFPISFYSRDSDLGFIACRGLVLQGRMWAIKVIGFVPFFGPASFLG